MTAVDPVAAVREILARVEAKLDAYFAEQARHGVTLERLDRTVIDNGNRITAVETTVREVVRDIDTVTANKTVTPAALAWALGFGLTALGVLITFLALYHGGP